MLTKVNILFYINFDNEIWIYFKASQRGAMYDLFFNS